MIPPLALISAGVLGAALWSREPVPVMETSPISGEPAAVPDAVSRPLAFPKLTPGLTGRVFDADPRILELTVSQPLKLADPLVYQSQGDMKDARLLGPMPASGSRTYSLEDAGESILIYSLAQQEVIDRGDLP